MREDWFLVGNRKFSTVSPSFGCLMGGPVNELDLMGYEVKEPMIGENRQLVTDEPVEFEK
jgi:hypothetical protein